MNIKNDSKFNDKNLLSKQLLIANDFTSFIKKKLLLAELLDTSHKSKYQKLVKLWYLLWNFKLFRYIFIGIFILIGLFLVMELANLNEPTPPVLQDQGAVVSRPSSKLFKFFENLCTAVYWIMGLFIIASFCYVAAVFYNKKGDTPPPAPEAPPFSPSSSGSPNVVIEPTTRTVSTNTQEFDSTKSRLPETSSTSPLYISQESSPTEPESDSLISKSTEVLTLRGPLQTIEDASLPDILEEKPYTPLSVVFEYLENDSECDSGNKIQIQNLWKMYSRECLRINKVYMKQGLQQENVTHSNLDKLKFLQDTDQQLSELDNQTVASLKTLYPTLDLSSFDIKIYNTSTNIQSTITSIIDTGSFD